MAVQKQRKFENHRIVYIKRSKRLAENCFSKKDIFLRICQRNANSKSYRAISQIKKAIVHGVALIIQCLAITRNLRLRHLGPRLLRSQPKRPKKHQKILRHQKKPIGQKTKKFINKKTTTTMYLVSHYDQ